MQMCSIFYTSCSEFCRGRNSHVGIMSGSVILKIARSLLALSGSVPSLSSCFRSHIRIDTHRITDTMELIFESKKWRVSNKANLEGL